MGQIVNHQYEIITKLDYEFTVAGHKIEVIGLARVSYMDTEGEAYKDVEIPDPEEHPNITMRVRVDGQEITDANDTQIDVFNEIYDCVVEILESEITPEKTDLTNDDFKDINLGTYVEQSMDNMFDEVMA